MFSSLKFLVGYHFLVLFLCSCCNNSKRPLSQTDSINKYEFVKILPKGKGSNLRYSYGMTQEMTKQAGLKLIENGFDSVYIRLWYIYNGPACQGIDIKKTGGVWSAEFYVLQGVKIGDSIMVQKKNAINKMPKSGWNLFIKNILSLGITNLPSDMAIPEYIYQSTDGSFVVVEIATVNKYRMYSYASPIDFPNIKEAKNIEDIMVLIEEEFDVKRLEKF